MKSALLIVLVFVSSSLLAQDGMRQLINDYQLARFATEGIAYDSFEGSPFIESEENKGIVILNDDRSFRDLNLRYNAFEDQMEYAKEADYIVIPTENLFNEFIIDGRHFYWNTFRNQNKKSPKYLELIANGNVRLYKQNIIDFVEGKKLKPYTEAKPASFIIRKPIYYIALGDVELIQIKNKKSIFGISSINTDELKKQIDFKDFDLNNEEDLVEIVQIMNQDYSLLTIEN